jgi:hypothetical protein
MGQGFETGVGIRTDITGVFSSPEKGEKSTVARFSFI